MAEEQSHDRLAKAMARGRGYAFETDNWFVDMVRRMNRGELPSQQPGREWFAEHPGARDFAADAFTYGPMGLRPGVGGRMASDFLLARDAPNGVAGGRLLARNQLTDQRAFNPTDYTGNPGRSFTDQSAPANSPAGDAYRHRIGYEDAASAQAQRRSFMDWEARQNVWRSELEGLGVRFDNSAMPALAQARAVMRQQGGPGTYGVWGDDPIGRFAHAHGSPPWYFHPETGRRLLMFDRYSVNNGVNHPFHQARQRYDASRYPPRGD
jgi:hypothetical protein